MSNTLFPSGATALSTTKRIEWIDALRGFTMILVVFSHIETLGFEMPRSTVNDFFSQFRMPLFFFISGFIAFRAGEVWNRQYFTRQMLKKMRIQIIPTLFFGLLFAITVFSHRYNETAGDSIFMFFDKVENTVLQATCSTALALLVIAFCLLLSNFIRTSPTLAYYLFGVKRDKAHTTPSNNPDSK